MLTHHVRTEVHYPVPPHTQLAMEGLLLGGYPISDLLHSTEISLPISVGHSRDDILKVCDIIKQFPDIVEQDSDAQA